MGRVVALRVQRERNEVAEEFAELSARARRRQITSSLHIVTGPGIDDETGLCGEFAEDLDYAIAVASKSLTLMKAQRDAMARTAATKPRRPRSHEQEVVSLDDDLPFMLQVA